MTKNSEGARQQALNGLGPEAVSPRLPLEPADADAEPAGPGAENAEQPIPYALTARARRVVAPERTPSLRVVDGDADELVEDQLDDPRSVQARALRRAGMPVSAIARRLQVDGFTVRAWLGGRAAPTPIAVAPSAPPRTPADDRDVRKQLEDRIETDPAFSAGVAALGAIADVDGNAVILVSDRPAPLAQALSFLRSEFEVGASQVRVVLRLGALVAGDRAVNDWAAVLGVATDRVRFVRSGRVPTPDGIEVLVRVSGGDVAASVSAWLHGHQQRWRPSIGRDSAGAPAG